MKNPCGPYPGRQIIIGKTSEGNPAFAYLVTGRSPASRERRATPKENSIVMGPIDSSDYDWLRHYTAIKYDNGIGLLAVSNGIKTEAIYELYPLLYNTATTPNKSYLKKVMDGANFEPDSLETPRISAVILNPRAPSNPSSCSASR
jgi:IMP cyclohydrolase